MPYRLSGCRMFVWRVPPALAGVMTPAERAHARRVFEETLRTVQQRYVPVEDCLLEALMPDATGQRVVVARYKLYVDGRVECFEVLDEVLWPSG